RRGEPCSPDELAEHVTLAMSADGARQRRELHGPGGEVKLVDLKPRVSGFDCPMLMALAERGVGITLLPETICSDAVRNGTLKVVLPQWRLPQGISHAAFASRRGMLPAGPPCIDFPAEKLPPPTESARLGCGEINGKPCSAEEEAAFRRQAGVL